MLGFLPLIVAKYDRWMKKKKKKKKNEIARFRPKTLHKSDSHRPKSKKSFLSC